MSTRIIALVSVFVFGGALGAFANSIRHKPAAVIHANYVQMGTAGCVSGAGMILQAINALPNEETANSIVFICATNSEQTVIRLEKEGKL